MSEAEQECAFEPGFAPCAECGRVTDERGTCQDYALCWKCKGELREAVGSEEFDRDYGQNILAAIEGHKYRPSQRVLHYDDGNGPLCHVRGGPHPVTDRRDDTNCKKCVRALGKGL